MPIKKKMVKALPSLFILFILSMLTNILDQHLNLKLQSEMRSESSHFFLIIFAIIFTNLFSIFIQEAVFLTNIQRYPSLPQFSMCTRYFDLIKENLKAIGSASLWMFLFVIPGLIRWIQYSLLPLIIFINPEYQNGEREALSFSRTLIKKLSWKFYFFWILFNCIIPLILSIFGGEFESFRETPLSAILLSSIQGLVFWLWMLCLWDFYDRSCSEFKLS
jgi:hypothetical protein